MKPVVAVLAGGASPEHDISLISASEVLNSLAGGGFPTLAVWIDRGDRWHEITAATPEPWTPHRLADLGGAVAGRAALASAHGLGNARVDVVFSCLHGVGGEDGRVQTLLQAAGLPYVGSGPAASSVAMSKLMSRLVFLGAGLTMPRAFLPTRQEAWTMSVADVRERLQREGLAFPLFLKEDVGGSSIGVERLEEASGLCGALERVRKLGPYWVLEECVSGVEVTCPVLGNVGQHLEALPPVEIRPRHSTFFDHASKYDAEATEELCPAPSLSQGETARCQDLAVRAHDLLGCSGVSRTDMILAGGEFYLLETNTIPGFTPASLLPRAASTVGMTFGNLLTRLVDLALEAGTLGALNPATVDPATENLATGASEPQRNA